MNVTKCNTVLMEKATKKEFWEKVRNNVEYYELRKGLNAISFEFIV